jgi:hypothetical protein
MRRENIAQNLERYYDFFIAREDPLDFFRGLYEYLDYAFSVPTLKEIFDEQLKERNLYYTNIENYEEKAISEMEEAKHKLLKSIKKLGVLLLPFERFNTIAIPPFEDFFKHLEAYENGEVQISGFQSDAMQNFLFDMAANLLKQGHGDMVADFIVSDDEYSYYHRRINGNLSIVRNVHGNFIFSLIWPSRWEEEKLLERSRSLKPWGAFEKLLRFKRAYEAVTKNENFWILNTQDQGEKGVKNMDHGKEIVDICEMIDDLEFLINKRSASTDGPFDLPVLSLESDSDYLRRPVFKILTETVHNILMRKGHEIDAVIEANIENSRGSEARRQEHFQNPVIPSGGYGGSINPGRSTTLLRPATDGPAPLTVINNYELKGLEKGLQKIVGSRIVKNADRAKFPYTIPSGIRWENISIQFTDEHHVNIQVAGHNHPTGYADMGFLDKRTNKPNKQWFLMLILAKNNGSLLRSSPDAQDIFKKQKQILAQKLQDYFRIEFDPFKTYNKIYNREGYSIKLTLIPPPSSNHIQSNDGSEVEQIFKEFQER